LTNRTLNTIIDQCLKGNPKGQQQLYEYTYTSIATVVSLYAKDNTERDWIFNTGMIKVFNSLNQFEKETNYLGWARTILVRSAIDHYRKETLKPTVNIDLQIVEYESNNYDLNAALANLEIEDIVSHIRQLPKREQTVFNLFSIEGVSHNEIEEATGINQNTSKWLLNKAKTKLQQLISRSTKLNCG